MLAQQNAIQTTPTLVPQTAQNNIVSIDFYWSIAEKAVKSSLAKVTNVADAFFLIGYGHELGISPFAALRTIYVVNGVPTCSGEMMFALIRRSGLLAGSEIEELRSDTGEYVGAKCSMTRKDTNETVSIEFTLKDAQVAGLLGKQVWKAYPKNMCRWRAVSNVAKLLFGDVIGGLYTFEEIADDNQQMDESGAPVGDIVSSTATKKEASEDRRKTIDPVKFADHKTTPDRERPEPAAQPEEKPEPTWIQESDNPKWLSDTMNANGLDVKTFYKKLDPKANGWNDIAKQYTDRKTLAKAIFDAMPSDTSEEDVNEDTDDLYENTFSIDALLPDTWDDNGEAYKMVCDYIEQYFDDVAEDVIKVGMAVEEPEKEYSNPAELWRAVVQHCTETGINLLADKFFYRSSGKYGRIDTYHPVLAVCFSRNKFVEMIGEPAFTDKSGIANWTAKDVPYALNRTLVISYETKTKKNTEKQYQLINAAAIKSLPDPDSLDDFFNE